MRKGFFGLLGVSFLLLWYPTAAHSLSFTLHDLGTLGGPNGSANGINAAGQVAGQHQPVGTDHFHAFRTAPNMPINPPTDDLGTFGGPGSEAFDINAAGQVVGSSSAILPGLPDRAFRTRPNMPLSLLTDDLGTLGGASSYAAAINDAGQVVGRAQTPSGFFHAFRTAPNMPINPLADDLGTFGGVRIDALGINSSGQVVGWAERPDGVLRAFRTAPNLPINPLTDDLGTLGGPLSSIASAINEAGQVVGAAHTADGRGRAFRTAPNQPINPLTDDLGTIGGVFSFANGINASGQVVGRADTAGGDIHAFIFTDGIMFDLNDLIPPTPGIVLFDADDINDAGQIAASGLILATRQTRAFRLDPLSEVSEPASLLLLGGSSLLGVALPAWRKHCRASKVFPPHTGGRPPIRRAAAIQRDIAEGARVAIQDGHGQHEVASVIENLLPDGRNSSGLIAGIG